VVLPFSLVLRQSAPNPFHLGRDGSVTIAFTIGGPPAEVPTDRDAFERVELSIYDVRGARVATLFSNLLGPGDYEATWSGESDGGGRVASGVYFYRLSAAHWSRARKLVVVDP
jgi:hypothetical protein